MFNITNLPRQPLTYALLYGPNRLNANTLGIIPFFSNFGGSALKSPRLTQKVSTEFQPEFYESYEKVKKFTEELLQKLYKNSLLTKEEIEIAEELNIDIDKSSSPENEEICKSSEKSENKRALDKCEALKKFPNLSQNTDSAQKLTHSKSETSIVYSYHSTGTNIYANTGNEKILIGQMPRDTIPNMGTGNDSVVFLHKRNRSLENKSECDLDPTKSINLPPATPISEYTDKIQQLLEIQNSLKDEFKENMKQINEIYEIAEEIANLVQDRPQTPSKELLGLNVFQKMELGDGEKRDEKVIRSRARAATEEQPTKKFEPINYSEKINTLRIKSAPAEKEQKPQQTILVGENTKRATGGYLQARRQQGRGPFKSNIPSPVQPSTNSTPHKYGEMRQQQRVVKTRPITLNHVK